MLVRASADIVDVDDELGAVVGRIGLKWCDPATGARSTTIANTSGNGHLVSV